MRNLPLVLFFLLSVIAGLIGYYMQKPDDSTELAQNEPSEKENAHTYPSLPENKSLSRTTNRDSAATAFVDQTPPFALKNERILRFKDEASYQKFLASLAERGLRLLGRSDRLRATRVGFRSLADLENIDGAESGFNFQVGFPTPAPGGVQEGAVGFGLDSLAWLGITEDNSAWGTGVTVAVIDSGINQHPAFDGGVTALELTTLEPGSNQSSHGTAVASIISGDSNVARGVAPSSEILSIRVTDANGTADAFTLAEGIIQAVEGGAQVINISLGTFGDSALVAEAVAFAQDSGSVIVASPGNNGIDLIAFPAAYDGVISVGAVERGGQKLDFSNSGNGLSITAPGLEVVSAWEETELTAFSGTSASAPFVSGAIAATMSENPNLTATQAADLVLSLANDAGLPGSDPDFGFGILDVGRVMDNGTSGIFDAAVTGQVLVPATNSSSLPQVLVTVQNQGTETLINSPVTITSPSGTRDLNVSSLSPGETQTFQVPIAIPTNGDSVEINTTIDTSSGDQDPSNNSQSTSFSQEQSP